MFGKARTQFARQPVLSGAAISGFLPQKAKGRDILGHPVTLYQS